MKTTPEKVEPFPFKKVLLALGLAAAVFIVINGGFFLKNAQFFFHRNAKPMASQQPNTSADDGLPHDQPDMLWIDSLNIAAPIKYIDQANETAYQAALKDGVVHYPGTADPGQPGNAYIFGHSSDYLWSDGHYKTVFALLPQISDNAVIKITDHQGRLYTYTVIRKAVIAANDTSVLSQYDNKQKLLTVQTSYPVGTALKRYIAVAELKE